MGFVSRFQSGLAAKGPAAALALLFACFMAGGVMAGAQAPAQTVLVEPPIPLLTPHAAGMTLGQTISGTASDARAEAFAGPGCTPTAPGAATGSGCPVDAAAVLKEDGLSRYAAGAYTHGAGGASVQALALQFDDATGAYSAYTFLRSLMKSPRVTEGDARLGKAHETSADAEGALVWAGTALLRTRGHLSAAELPALAAALPKVGGRRGLPPLLPTYLAPKGLIAGTERYALGPAGYKAMGGTLPVDLLAWDKSAEVLTAEYSGHGGRGLETLMLYPTPQIAGDRGRALEKFVNESGPATFGSLKMRRVGPLLGMTTGGLGADQAADLMAGLHLSQELSFDKRMPLEFHAEVRKTATLLQSIAMFCVVGLVAAVVLAVFLGGARAGIRVLQGKPAASEPEFLSINLRGERKGLFAPKAEIEEGKLS